MTKEEINRQIAEKVMGWKEVMQRSEYLWAPGHYTYVDGPWYKNEYGLQFLVSDWNPSELMYHAWMVVEKLQDKSPMIWKTMKGKWRASFSHENIVPDIWAEADTAPMAISLAALKACEGEDE